MSFAENIKKALRERSKKRKQEKEIYQAAYRAQRLKSLKVKAVREAKEKTLSRRSGMSFGGVPLFTGKNLHKLGLAGIGEAPTSRKRQKPKPKKKTRKKVYYEYR